MQKLRWKITSSIYVSLSLLFLTQSYQYFAIICALQNIEPRLKMDFRTKNKFIICYDKEYGDRLQISLLILSKFKRITISISPENHQKTVVILIISGGIEVN